VSGVVFIVDQQPKTRVNGVASMKLVAGEEVTRKGVAAALAAILQGA